MTESIKSANAALLNRLSEMQQAPYYATARQTLAEAERVIGALEKAAAFEREVSKLHAAEKVQLAQDAARAFAIADGAMYEILLSEGVSQDGSPDDATAFGLVDENYLEVTKVAEASPALREAFEWLQARGYVELGSDGDGEFVQVVRRPGEE